MQYMYKYMAYQIIFSKTLFKTSKLIYHNIKVCDTILYKLCLDFATDKHYIHKQLLCSLRNNIWHFQGFPPNLSNIYS